MNYIGKVFSNVRDFYNEINAATLTGAIDILVVERENGTFACSPFHVRFGKLGVLRAREKVVDIEINGEPVDIHMKLGEAGEAFFVEELEQEEDCPAHLATSPIPSSTYLDQLPSIRDASPEEALSTLTITGESTAEQQSGKLSPPKCDAAIQTEGEDAEAEETQAEPEEPPNVDVEGEARMPAQVSHRRQESQKRKKRRRGVTGPSPSLNGPGSVRKRSLQQQSYSREEDQFEMEDVDNPDVGRGLGRSATVGAALGQADMPEPDENNEGTWSRRMSRSMGPNFHFFSDTEVSPVGSPLGSRPSSPVQSDTEYERQHSIAIQTEGGGVVAREGVHESQQASWKWGELPSTTGTSGMPTPMMRPHQNSNDASRTRNGDDIVSSDEDDAAAMAAAQKEQKAAQQRWLLGGMFNFMRKTKHQRAAEGVYLDDLKLEELDPQQTALYFPASYRTGPNSKDTTTSASPDPTPELSTPTTQTTAIPANDEDNESGQGTSLPQSPHGSLDGIENGVGVSGPKSLDSDFEDGRANSAVAFSLCGWEMGREVKEESFLEHQVHYEQLAEDPNGILSDPKLVVRVGGRYVPWGAGQAMVASQFLFGRSLPEPTIRRMMEEFVPPSPNSSMSEEASKGKDQEAKRTSYSWFSWRRSEPKSTTPTTATAPALEEVSEVAPEPLPVPSSVHGDEHYAASASSEESDGESGGVRRHGMGPPGASPKKLPLDKRPYYMPPSSERYRKTLRLSTDQIASLNLREGANEVMFSVTTAYQGTTRCKCHIYRWRYDDKIVVSDIDGTITKSDVLGHILPIIGRDWAQSGVAQLFNKINNNGYKLLYLSARAIGQARITRDYLRSIKQGDLSLPEGPLLLNPTSLLNAFHREVIEKKPEDFKISCLRDVQALYPMQRNPFYAGYGNKINDVWSYRAVGIPISRIFTINHRGELKHELTQTFQSSYSNLSYIVDHIFPPRVGTLDICQPSDEFSQFVYWRDPVPELEEVVSEVPIASPSPQSASRATSPHPDKSESSPNTPPPTPTSPNPPTPTSSPSKAK